MSKLSIQNEKRQENVRKYCERRFTQSQAAKKHERIHTGEKPFGCKICDYKSNNSGNLWKDEKIHGKVKIIL